MTEKTATQVLDDMRLDLRAQRAMSLAHSTLKALEPFIAEASWKHAYEALMDVYMQNGVDIVTDDMRREAGLPPRDDKGWTAQELAAMEIRRMEILTRPIQMMVPLK